MIDIHINDDKGIFKYRACVILKHNDKYLIVKMNQNKFYCFPGGHVELGERSETAVIREAKEELNVDVKIEKLFAIHQNIVKRLDKTYHEIGYYFVCKAIDENQLDLSDHIYIENDKGYNVRHEYKWVTLDELKITKFLPLEIKNLILTMPDSQNNIL